MCNDDSKNCYNRKSLVRRSPHEHKKCSEVRCHYDSFVTDELLSLYENNLKRSEHHKNFQIRRHVCAESSAMLSDIIVTCNLNCMMT